MIKEYEDLRKKYRPEKIRILLIGESPPDRGGGELSFFYSTVLSSHDNLFKGVAEAIYGEEAEIHDHDKVTILKWLKRDGYWLIDLCPSPINKLQDKEKQAEIAKNRDILIEKVKELKPSVGVIICKANIYREVAESIRRAGINVLHNVPIPFPSNNGSKKPQFKTQRDEFVSSFRDIIKRCK